MTRHLRFHRSETLKISGRSMLGWQTLAWTGAVTLLLFLMGLRNHTLWDYHEPYVGGIIREMAASGDWVLPTLNGAPYLEKPPLFYALGALCCRVFGSSDPWVLRLPSALLATATVGWVSYLGWRLSSARAGGWAGFMVATNALFFVCGHEAIVDMALTAAVTFSLSLAYLAIVEPFYRERWVGWFWLSLGLAFLAKGVFGPVIILAPLAVVFWLQRGTRLLRAFLRPNWGMALAVLLVLGWVLPLGLRKGGGEFLFEVFVRNSLGRFMASPDLVSATGNLGEHVEPFYFYFARTPGNVLPWLAIWGAALWAAIPVGKRPRVSVRYYFLPLAFGLNLVLLSLSEAKRMVYLMPLVPLSLLHAALWLDLQFPKKRAWAQKPILVILGVTLAFVGLLGVGFPWVLVDRVHTHWSLALVLSLGSAGMSGYSLYLLSQRRFPVVLDWTMAQWSLFLVSFLIFGVPELDREWRPILEPFHLAHRLEAQGATVYVGRMAETGLGYASLEFKHLLPVADTPERVQDLLSAEAPVVLLLDTKHYWRGQLKDRVTGAVEIPTAASRSRKLWDRAPTLVLNAPAAALLHTTP